MDINTPGATQLWYAITVKPRHEKEVDRQLGFLGLESFLPLYRSRRAWSDRIKTVELCLFPGYVFCRVPRSLSAMVRNLPGVISFVGFGGRPTPVSEEEIQAVRAIAISGASFGPWPYLAPGDQVRILCGPLAGLTGTLVRERGDCRLVVNVELLKRSVAVEIDRDWVEPIRTPELRSRMLTAVA